MNNDQGMGRIWPMIALLAWMMVATFIYLPQQMQAESLYHVSPKIPHKTDFPLFKKKSPSAQKTSSVSALQKQPDKKVVIQPFVEPPVNPALEVQNVMPEKKVSDLEVLAKTNAKSKQPDTNAQQARATQSLMPEQNVVKNQSERTRPQKASTTAEKILAVKPYSPDKLLSNNPLKPQQPDNTPQHNVLVKKAVASSHSGQSASQSVSQPLSQPASKPVEIASASPPTLQQDPVKLYEKANNMAKKGQYKEAALVYQQALKINPKLADAYVGMAASFGAFKKWDRAILLLKDALKYRAHFLDKFNLKHAHYNLAVAYCMNGQLDSAWNSYMDAKSMKHPYKRHLKKFLKKNCPR